LVRTRFSELLWKGKNGDDGIFMKSIENGTYLRRAAEPYEMAGAMCFACSDDASYMTGEVMLVHGGGSARL
jgi:NAD(P)-dependent dehydrogenase (short-subunit alcohol dehydrogenase family)